MSDTPEKPAPSRNVIGALFNSKKFIALLVSTITIVLVQFVGVSEAAAAEITDKLSNLAMAYLGAQGVADLGIGLGKRK